MNKIITGLVVLCAAYGNAFAQKAVVSGNIKGLKDGNIILYSVAEGNPKADTVKTAGGKFKWTGIMSEPQKINLRFPDRLVSVYAEAGTIVIKGDANALNRLVITGSSVQREADAFEASVKDLNDQTEPLYQKYGKVSKEEQLLLEEQLEHIRVENGNRVKQYISTHPKSYFSLDLVKQRTSSGQYQRVKSLYDLLDPTIQQSNQGKKIAEQLAVLKRSATGEPFLDFTQNDPAGKAVRFSDFSGKYVLIDFWASWCGPCRAENPNVLKEYNLYKGQNFTVVSVSLDDKADRWKKAIEEDKLPWTQVSDLKGFKNELSSYYGIAAIPTTILVDPNGKIIAKDLRGEILAKKLREIFN